ncbi:cytochrome P450 [Pilobolus umbonatus]|nr:cytochrome P450 [Pilobolus umbonatus]
MKVVGVLGGATLAAIGALAIKYNDRAVFYEHPNMPHTSGHPLIGDLYNIANNTDYFHDYSGHLFKKLNTMTYSISVLGNVPHVNTIDPRNVDHILRANFKNYTKGPKFIDSLHDLLGEGIFNANGENWKYQRKAASYIFNVKNFRDEFTNVFVKEMMVMDTHILQKAADNGQLIDFSELMFKFTMDSFVSIGFGVHLDSLLMDGPAPFAASFDYLQQLAFLKIVNPIVPVVQFAKKIFTPWKMTAEDHVKVVNNFAASVIKKRRIELEKGAEFKDLLSRFMNTTNQHGNKLNDEELRDSILNFIIAGRDTTAQALSWLFYNIMLQPRIEKKMLEEIEKVITDETELDPVSLYETISGMPYIHAVFYETLRLYPSVPGNQKYALEDDIWPDGTEIKAGHTVGWSSYNQGRNKDTWGEDAADFVPERWIEKDGSLKRASASEWPAFHHGPRVCLGQNLATLEALVSVIMLLRRYTFELAPDQEITYQISLTLPMKYGMKVFVRRR